jgi:hypothetical protein
LFSNPKVSAINRRRPRPLPSLHLSPFTFILLSASFMFLFKVGQPALVFVIMFFGANVPVLGFLPDLQG